jgi:hypothetical protein
MWLKLILYLVEIGLLVWSLFTPSGRDAWGWFFNNVVASAFKQATPLVNELSPDLQAVGKSFSDAVGAQADALTGALGGDFQAVAKRLLVAQRGALASLGESTADNALDSAAEAFTVAMGAGLTSAGITALFEALFPEKLNTLNGVGPMVAKMAGFDEVAAEVLGPLYKSAFGRSLEYYYRAKFKPELPNEADAVLWHARRLLTDDQLRKIFSFSGLKDEYETPFIDSAYRAVQPRALATLYQDVEFDRDRVKDMLQFAGIRGDGLGGPHDDLGAMLDGFKLASVRNVRNQYVAGVVRAAELGVLSDAEVTSDLNDLGFSADAQHWVKLTIATRKLQQLAELYRKSISEAYQFGNIADGDYVNALEAIGISQADAQAHFAIDSIKKHGKDAEQLARAAAAAQRVVDKAEIAAARADYHGGVIDDVVLATRFAAAQMPALAIPFAVEVEIQRARARKRYVFGVLLGPDQALHLRERVAALKEQRVKKLIDDPTALAQLQSWGIPDSNAGDLVAAWAAQADKTQLPIT